MTITLLDLYNSTASQEWAMYDNDARSDAEFEDSLVLAINKAILQIFTSYNFPFRERTHLILTIPRLGIYDMPNGLIKQDKNGKDFVKSGQEWLKLTQEQDCLEPKFGKPDRFFVKNDKLVFYPIPMKKDLITIDYFTLVVGESAQGEELYSLKKDSDKLLVPAYLEELMKEAIITRTMLNTIASETDENYSAYKKQADKAYKTLVKYAKGVGVNKQVKF